MTTPPTPADPCAAERKELLSKIATLEETLDRLLVAMLMEVRDHSFQPSQRLQEQINCAYDVLDNLAPQEDQ